MTPLEAALDYLARGWSVIPAVTTDALGVCQCPKAAQCDSPGKHPRVKWLPYQDRLPTHDELVDWWVRWPDAGVIIITGRVSGIVVLDVDPRHQGDVSLALLPALPATLTALTGGGGQHYYFQHPGYEIRNAAGLADGIDFRGDGGYVVAPPTVHSSGQPYTWDLGQPDTPAPLPAALRDLHARARRAVGSDPADRAFDPERILVDPVPEGRRNETLVRIAGHYAADGRPYHDLLRTVLGCNYDLCTPPLGRDEVVQIVESIYQAEQRKREVAREVEQHINGHTNGSIPASDTTLMARRLWGEMVDGLVVEDWYLVRGDRDDYILVTDSNVEVTLGNDVLNQTAIRRQVMNATALMLKPYDSKKEWPRRAQLLRQVAREVDAEDNRAVDRVNGWLDAMADDEAPAIEPPMEERLEALRQKPVVIDSKLYVKSEVLVRYLERNLAERLPAADVKRILRRAGWERSTVRVGAGTTRAWVQARYRKGPSSIGENEGDDFSR